MFKARTLIATAFLISASAASATATIRIVANDPPTARITYDDLDLSSANGAGQLRHRIRSAAQQVCRVAEYGSGPVNPMADQSECYRGAVASGLSQMKQIATQ